MDREGIGKKTIRALSMVADVVWGAQPSYEDPARYSFAHGGKDGYPYPVNQDRYRESIDVLSEAIRRSKLGDDSKVKAFERLKTSFGEGGSPPEKMGLPENPGPSVSGDPPVVPSQEDADDPQYSLDFREH